MLDPAVFFFFTRELEKTAAMGRLRIGLVPGLGGGAAPGLAKPIRASGQNFAKFQRASQTKITGSSPTANAPGAISSVGQTGSTSIPTSVPSP